MQIDWLTWSAARTARWSRVFDSLWTRLSVHHHDDDNGGGGGGRVVKLKHLCIVERELGSTVTPGMIEIVSTATLDPNKGDVTAHHENTTSSTNGRRQMHVRCIDGWISVGQITLAGGKEHDAGDTTTLHGRTFSSILDVPSKA